MKQGWEIKKLGEVFDLQMGKTPSRDNGDYWGGDNVWVAISDLQDKYIGESKEHITDKALTETKIKKVKAGTTIMSFKLSVGRAAITTQDLYTNEAIMAFNLNEGYDLIADYIYYYLKGYKWQGANKAVMGLTLNKASISQNHIAIPPREEQERIVEELDCLSGIIEKKREQLKGLDALAQSIFYQMFGDPITNEKGWEVKKMGEEFEVSSGGTPDTKNPSYWDNGDISWIGSNMCQNEIIYQNDGKYITADGLSHSSAKEYHNGYVLVALVGATIGKVALLKFMTTTNQNIAGINAPANKEYTSEYVFYLMQNLYNLFREVGGDKFKMANLSFVRSLPIPKPSYTLQQQFAERIEKIEQQKKLISQSIKEVEDLFNSRMNYYFN